MRSFSHIKRGSALIITIFITMILMLVGLYLLEKIIPIARSVKGVENSNAAVEEVLLNTSPATVGTEYADHAGDTKGLGWDASTSSSGMQIPAPGK